MASKFKPALKEFKGDHPYFENGEQYTYRQFSKGASNYNREYIVKIANELRVSPEDIKPDVMPATIKNRLYGCSHCTPEHLRPVGLIDLTTLGGKYSKKGYSKARREQVLNQPRLEDKQQRLMDKFLRVKL